MAGVTSWAKAYQGCPVRQAEEPRSLGLSAAQLVGMLAEQELFGEMDLSQLLQEDRRIVWDSLTYKMAIAVRQAKAATASWKLGWKHCAWEAGGIHSPSSLELIEGEPQVEVEYKGLDGVADIVLSDYKIPIELKVSQTWSSSWLPQLAVYILSLEAPYGWLLVAPRKPAQLEPAQRILVWKKTAEQIYRATKKAQPRKNPRPYPGRDCPECSVRTCIFHPDHTTTKEF